MDMVCIGLAWVGGVLCGGGIGIMVTGNVFHDRRLRNSGAFMLGVGGALSLTGLLLVGL